MEAMAFSIGRRMIDIIIRQYRIRPPRIIQTVFYDGGGQSMKDILDLICYVILAVYEIYEKYKK